MSRRTVLVTGGNRGIGLACARTFAEQGDRVAVTCRGEAPPEVLEAGLLPVACDITDADQVEAAFARVEEELGAVEVLVSNAGITRDSLVLRMSDDDFTDVLEANLTGGFRVARRAVKGMMRARWGRIVFVSSIAGRIGQAGQANYAASKAGLVGLGRSFAKEFASRGVTVNVVAPGPIATDMLSALPEDQLDAYADAVPLGRLGRPEEIAAAVRFLASDEAGYITGAVLPVDGGLFMG
ncbi:MAG: beta-ketoacyl-ACP reductase [Acidimicrobiales bacterium]|jgi:3-oxoacyl-[acyl-carrier protein] reductase|nr:beta-ketoacyl-ACP reductase [Acidimicrobiales bacterium]MDE0749262.1 beta-ketoacyl-ACP reductase [Acidimicrobiales bacterium]|tara:strand:- start:2598 stop:3314 length:717 start_codon:yes stop_codon:yes gene_type:complete